MFLVLWKTRELNVILAVSTPIKAMFNCASELPGSKKQMLSDRGLTLVLHQPFTCPDPRLGILGEPFVEECRATQHS